MKHRSALLSLSLVLFCAAAQGAVLPPEKLLPKDTLVVVTAPDAQKLFSVAGSSALGQLWHSPEMKPFRDKFGDKFQAQIGPQLEKDLGIKLEDFSSLAQGQVTFAILSNDQAEKPEERFSTVLMLDAKDHSDQLKKNLASVKKKWADASKPMKVEKIHDFEFTTFTSEENPLDSLKPKPGPPADGEPPPPDGAAPTPPKRTDIIFGQVDSLLIVSGSVPAIEKILNRQTGGLTPALEEQPAFQIDLNARLRTAPLYAWVNAKALTDALAKAHADDDLGTPGSLPISTILSASGLNDITSAAATVRESPDGMTMQVFVSVPEGNRHGLIKAFAVQAKDSSPPAFVPADAMKFWRWRVDLPQSWKTLEKMVGDISPTAASGLNFIFSSAGKDKDEKYDLKSELLGNLGNDVISYAKAARGASLADFKNPPTVTLIGSPNPEKLAAALKVAMGMMTQGTGGIKEQDFLGRKIYSLNLPAAKGEPNPLSFAASASYIALSADSGMVEEFLRSDEGKAKPLSDTPGLRDAAQKVGGMSQGFFEYENNADSMKNVFNLVHTENLSISDIFGAPSVQMGANPTDQLSKLKDWADFSLLPSFDTVSKYFHFTVQSVNFTPEGFSWTIFSPIPPRLR